MIFRKQVRTPYPTDTLNTHPIFYKSIQIYDIFRIINDLSCDYPLSVQSVPRQPIRTVAVQSDAVL